MLVSDGGGEEAASSVEPSYIASHDSSHLADGEKVPYADFTKELTTLRDQTRHFEVERQERDEEFGRNRAMVKEMFMQKEGTCTVVDESRAQVDAYWFDWFVDISVVPSWTWSYACLYSAPSLFVQCSSWLVFVVHTLHSATILSQSTCSILGQIKQAQEGLASRENDYQKLRHDFAEVQLELAELKAVALIAESANRDEIDAVKERYTQEIASMEPAMRSKSSSQP